jgi:very-short-patch-repair endonuclease
MRLEPHKTTKRDYSRARQLRNDPSPIEKTLWRLLRAQAAVCGLKFRRQAVIHPYIADFACFGANLLVELDGPSHDARQDYDRKREDYLQKQGYRVLRFSNNDVVENTLGVVETIIRETTALLRKTSGAPLAALPPPLIPPLKGEGNG